MELVEKANQQTNLLESVLQQSNILATTRFNKPVIGPTSHLDITRKAKTVLNNKQLFALQEIYAWRDDIARQEDESTNYIIPNHMLLKICTELPREMQGILACCNPVPPLVKQNLHTLHLIILKARAKVLQAVDTDLSSSQYSNAVVGNENEYNENPLKCPLDLGGELGVGLKTFIDSATGKRSSSFPLGTNNNICKKHSDLGVLGPQS